MKVLRARAPPGRRRLDVPALDVRLGVEGRRRVRAPERLALLLEVPGAVADVLGHGAVAAAAHLALAGLVGVVEAVLLGFGVELRFSRAPNVVEEGRRGQAADLPLALFFDGGFAH